MEQEVEYRRQIVQKYRSQAEPLFRYLPWLAQKKGTRTAGLYDGEGIGEHSMPVPVYDGTLMNFVKDAQKTGLLNRNYVYVYSRNRIRSAADEKRMIENATVRDMETLTGILSKYILGGMTKAYLWPQGVEEGVYLAVLSKMKEILEFWDKPLA